MSPPLAHAPRRVVFHVEGDVFGGVESHLCALLRHLDRCRYQPLVLCRNVPELVAALGDLDVEVRVLDPVRSKADVGGWWGVIRAVGAAHADVYHGMLSHSHAGQYALAAAQLLRVPATVETVHLVSPAADRRQQQLRRLLVNGLDQQLAPSHHAADELRRLDQAHPSLTVVPNGVDVAIGLSRPEARQQLGLFPDELVVGAVMRLEPSKRTDLLLHAARLLAPTPVVVLGDGPQMADLRRAAHGTGARFVGFRPSAASLMSAFDVLLHPNPAEAQGLVVLEAMAAGVPVVGVAGGGLAETIEDGVTGMLVRARADDLAGGARRLLEDPALRHRLAAAGAAAVATRFSAEAMAQEIQDIYDRLLGVPRRRAS